MKFIIADPDEKTGSELKKLLAGYKKMNFQGHFRNFEEMENSIIKEYLDIAFVRIGKTELNAFRLIEAIRELYPLAKIIITSSNVEYAVEAFDCGVDGFLFIPFDKQKIEHFLMRWLENKEIQ